MLGRLATAALIAVAAASGCARSSTSGPPSIGPVAPPKVPTAPLGGSAGTVQESLATALEAVSCTAPKIDLKVLVLAADNTEPTLAAITQTLDLIGTPYTVWNVNVQPPMTAADLYSDCRAFYQAVFLTNGELAFDDVDGVWKSGFTPEEWQTLFAFEKRFGIRQVSLYTYPSPEFGFVANPQTVATDTVPLAATLTAEGKKLFPYLTGTLEINDSWTYLAQPLDANTVPLLVDDVGNTLAAVVTYPDGRLGLNLTFDGNPWVTHSVALGYGLVEWATRGMFIGERRVYLGAQVDDLLIEDDIWPEGVYRMTGKDLRAVAAWQNARHAEGPMMADFRFDFAYNGEGSSGVYDPDPLTPVVKDIEWKFKWINHTYDHLNLDDVDTAMAQWEVRKNKDMAGKLGLTDFFEGNMVTPDLSGLTNYNFLKGAYAEHIRYVVCDTSKGCVGKWPNTAVVNTVFPGILMLPRYPNNLFYNVSRPVEWVDEYNTIHGAYWGRSLSFEEILDKESTVLANYMIKGDMSPLMFHQANLRAYDGTHFLLGDLIDATLAKYRAVYNLKVLSPKMDELAKRLQKRLDYQNAAITATLTTGKSITFFANDDVTLPVTGLCRPDAERYGGDCTSWVKLPRNKTFVLALP